MKTATSGNAAEGAVLNALVLRGYDVLLPFGEGHPFDLVVHIAGRFIRVQVKTAWVKQGCVLFNPYATDHGNGIGSYVGRADVFGVFSPDRDAVYLVPLNGVASQSGRLRIEPTRNNQSRRVRYADQFEISQWDEDRLLRLLDDHPATPQLDLDAA